MKFESIIKLFEDQVKRTPEAIAIVFQGESLSYFDLNQKANQIAHYINSSYEKKHQKKIPKETFIGLFIRRSPDLIASILAVLKLGCAYVSVDPTYPRERTQYIFSDIHIQVLLYQNELSDFLKQENSIHLNVKDQGIEKAQSENLTIDLSPHDLAYAIYSSGSTGKPKGILIEHKGVPNLAKYQKQYYSLKVGSRVLQGSTFNWDGSVFETFSTLISGATLYIIDDELKTDPVLLTNFLKNHKINVATFTSRCLESWPLIDLPDLQNINITSEVCHLKTLRYWAKGRHLINAFGPTECTVCSSFYTYDPNQIEAANIGQPITNTEFHILDEEQNPVAEGEAGELYICGIGVARGYANLAEFSESKFLKNFKNSGKTFYRTGDFIRKLPTGNYEYLGRKDQMAKINGYTLQLGEVENVILTREEISQVIVIVDETEGKKRLIAFCLCTNPSYTPELLRKYLETKLPGFMIPTRFVFLDQLLYLPNGKVDLQTLKKIHLAKGGAV